MTAYRTLLADPPWKFGDSLPGDTRGATKNYRTMTVDQIEVMLLPDIADDALLFLWRVSAMQEEALRVIRAWGFEPKSEIVWVKTTGAFEVVEPGQFPVATLKFGMGRYVRASHEVCLIARRGKAKVLNRATRSVFFAPVGSHSEKPACFYDIVESLSEGPRCELFARERREGWASLGNELPRLGEAPPLDVDPRDYMDPDEVGPGPGPES